MHLQTHTRADAQNRMGPLANAQQRFCGSMHLGRRASVVDKMMQRVVHSSAPTTGSHEVVWFFAVALAKFSVVLCTIFPSMESWEEKCLLVS